MKHHPYASGFQLTKEKIEYYLQSGWNYRLIANLYATDESNVKNIQGIKEKVSRRNNEGRDYFKEKVRNRDKHKCQDCGRKQETQNKSFDVHSLSGTSARAYGGNMDDYITLCHRCNMTRMYMQKRLSTPIA